MAARSVDDNGYLTVRGCPLTSHGIFQYSAGQVGLPGDPHRIVNVYRPEEEVSDPEAIESFKNIPFIDEHNMLSGFEDESDEEFMSPEEKGVEGILTSEVYYADPWVRGDLKIFSRRLQRAMKAKKDLSLGYGCEFVIESGNFNGTDYEVIQRRMRGNHIALVKEGRVAGARVLDGLCYDHLNFDIPKPSKGDNGMTDKQKAAAKAKAERQKACDSAVERLKEMLPALQEFLDQEAKEPEHNVDADEFKEGEEFEEGRQDGERKEYEEEKSKDADLSSGEGDKESIAAEILDRIESLLGEVRDMRAADKDDAKDKTCDEEKAQDKVDGLQESSQHKGAQVAADSKEEIIRKAEDAALQRFYADSHIKNTAYDRLSKVVGAFDHSRMDAKAVYRYGVKKLAIDCAEGQERIAVDAYLNAIEKAKADAKTSSVNNASDSKINQCDELDAYLKGEQ